MPQIAAPLKKTERKWKKITRKSKKNERKWKKMQRKKIIQQFLVDFLGCQGSLGLSFLLNSWYQAARTPGCVTASWRARRMLLWRARRLARDLSILVQHATGQCMQLLAWPERPPLNFRV